MGKDVHRMLLAVVLSFGIMFCWQYFFPVPKASEAKSQVVEQIVERKSNFVQAFVPDFKIEKSKENGKSIEILTPNLKGSISTLGLEFNDLILLNHKDKVGPDSNPVVLFDKFSHFVSFRLSNGTGELPDAKTLWTANGNKITCENPVEFSWKNKNGVKFFVKVAVDENYLFTFDTKIQNNSAATITLNPSIQILKKELEDDSGSHKGAIGCLDGQIKEYSYKDLNKKGKFVASTLAMQWFGITDKYWLAALIADKPQNAKIAIEKIKVGESDYMINNISYFDQEVQPYGNSSLKFHLFAGAKHVELLDKYRVLLNVPLLDRAIDFGWLHFLVKPLFHFLNFFYGLVKNFGVSIILLTLAVRIVMFVFAMRSEATVRKMKEIQPKMQRLKDLYKDDQERLRKEIMDLYKKEKVSPIGCLPMLAQVPVFFAMYKVLDVALELRHAPFFWWIFDLSAKDPTNIFTIFGLLPWNHPAFLHLGVWPILMSVSLYLQQKISPQPVNDPVQAKVIALMPLIMLFTVCNLAAGLVVYWTWSNCFGIGQQYLMNVLTQRKARLQQS